MQQPSFKQILKLKHCYNEAQITTETCFSFFGINGSAGKPFRKKGEKSTQKFRRPMEAQRVSVLNNAWNRIVRYSSKIMLQSRHLLKPLTELSCFGDAHSTVCPNGFALITLCMFT